MSDQTASHKTANATTRMAVSVAMRCFIRALQEDATCTGCIGICIPSFAGGTIAQLGREFKVDLKIGLRAMKKGLAALELSYEAQKLMGGLLVGEGFDAGKFLAFEEFEAGAAAGGDVGYLVGYAGLVDGAD